MKSPSNAPASTTRWWIVAAGACAVLGLLALVTSGSSPPPSPQGERRTSGPHRPDLEHRSREAGRSTAAPSAPASGAEDALSPELEERLRAAARVSTAPAPRPPGAPPLPLPPTGPLAPEAEAQRQQALVGWKHQAQALLDGCVPRRAAERQPVMLNVMFAPAPAAADLAVQQLSPAVVSIPPHDLRRLWRDIDPDELQGCLERVRALPLSVPMAPRAVAQVLPPSTETLLVQL
ncbi:MAG TPA: hypothetical protein VN253_02835 [Kofleriaceae bacterium]|nr:hypothetical protein [Kofleriaceae bacterium]